MRLLLLLILLPLLQAEEIRYVPARILVDNPEMQDFRARLMAGKSGMIFSDFNGCLPVQGSLRHLVTIKPWEANVTERWAGWLIGRVLSKDLPFDDIEAVVFRFIPQIVVRYEDARIRPKPYLSAKTLAQGGCIAEHPKFVFFTQYRHWKVIL